MWVPPAMGALERQMTIAITVVATVFSGTIVFIVGQIFLVLFLERIRAQARCVEEIAQALALYRPLYLEIQPNSLVGGSEQAREASVELRRLGSILMANSQTIRLYELWTFLRFVFPRSTVLGISRELLMLCQICPPLNSGHIESAAIHEQEIKRLLGIEVH